MAQSPNEKHIACNCRRCSALWSRRDVPWHSSDHSRYRGGGCVHCISKHRNAGLSLHVHVFRKKERGAQTYEVHEEETRQWWKKRLRWCDEVKDADSEHKERREKVVKNKPQGQVENQEPKRLGMAMFKLAFARTILNNLRNHTWNVGFRGKKGQKVHLNLATNACFLWKGKCSDGNCGGGQEAGKDKSTKNWKNNNNKKKKNQIKTR